MFIVKANNEAIHITPCPEDLEEYLDEHEELLHRHGYEVTVNDQPIHTLEHPLLELFT